MPAVLEEPAVEVPKANDRIEIRVRTTVVKSSERRATNPERMTTWGKIFQGHEEYLGYTPD